MGLLGGAYTGKTMWERYQDEETLNHQAAVGGEEAMYLPVKKAVEAHKDDQGVWYTVAPGPRSTIGDDHWWDDVTSTCIGKLRQAAPPGINGGTRGTSSYRRGPTHRSRCRSRRASRCCATSPSGR
nr:hypothetical protein [Angustibacter aerolatus]